MEGNQTESFSLVGWTCNLLECEYDNVLIKGSVFEERMRNRVISCGMTC